MKTEGGMAWVVLLVCRAGGIPPAYSGCHEFLLGRILEGCCFGEGWRYPVSSRYRIPGNEMSDSFSFSCPCRSGCIRWDGWEMPIPRVTSSAVKFEVGGNAVILCHPNQPDYDL